MIVIRIMLLLALLPYGSCLKQIERPSGEVASPLLAPRDVVGIWYINGYKLTSLKDGVAIDSVERQVFYDAELFSPSKLIIWGDLSGWDNGSYDYQMPDSTAITLPINYLFSMTGWWKIDALNSAITLSTTYVQSIRFQIEDLYFYSCRFVGRYYDDTDRLYHLLTLYLER